MKWPLVIFVALAASACADAELKRLSAIRDTVCACKTAKCAEEALAGVPKKPVASSPRSQRIAREMMDCLAELYELDRPTADPDADITAP